MPKLADDVEHYGERYAEQDRGSQGEIECRRLATIDNVAGQTSERQMSPARQRQQDAKANNHHTDDDEKLPDIGHTLIVDEGKSAPDSILADLLSLHYPLKALSTPRSFNQADLIPFGPTDGSFRRLRAKSVVQHSSKARPC